MLVVKKLYLDSRIKLLCVKNIYSVRYISTPTTSAFCDYNLKSNETKSSETYTSVQDYYAGKSVLITGGTGFLGKVLLEKLLSTCTKLDKIYLLVREKNSEPLSSRLQNDIFKNPLFERLNKQLPDSLNKVIPIAGDITEPNLAIATDDIKTLVEKVSVVFHAAATVNFNEPWDISLRSNLEGTKELLKLCKRMENLETFVHVSTAYAIAKDNGDNVIEEKLYPGPNKIERVYDFAKKNKNKQNTKKFLGGLANTYTYTKALAETHIAENHGDIPTCIIRPSIVAAKIEEPQIGWLDNRSVAIITLMNVAVGFNRVTLGNGDQVSDLIPVDYVANTCIVAAAKQNGSKDIKIYNTCTSDVNPATMREIYKLFIKDTVKHGWNDFPFPFTLFLQNRILVAISTFFLQLVPAFFVDFYLIVTRKKPRYSKVQSRVIHLRESVKFFTANAWVIKSGNVRSLYSSLSEHDRRLFPCDPAQIDWKKYIPIYSQGVNKFITHYK